MIVKIFNKNCLIINYFKLYLKVYTWKKRIPIETKKNDSNCLKLIRIRLAGRLPDQNLLYHVCFVTWINEQLLIFGSRFTENCKSTN